MGMVYPTPIAELVAAMREMPLGPGRSNPGVNKTLKALTPQSAFEGQTIADREMAMCVLSGLWLAHNDLDASHTISQSIETPTGSYWHGIMHRREGDYSNAKYWFRRVGNHPVFAALVCEAQELGMGAVWDPLRFVDLCEQAAGDGELELACMKAQGAEWRELFDFCYRKAVGV